MRPSNAGDSAPTVVPASLSEPLLRAEDVARLFGIPRSSVYEYVRSQQIPHIRIGKHVRFVRTDLEDWIGGRRTSYVARRFVPRSAT